MAEKKVEAKKDFNIENLEALQREYITNKMIPRKAEMLRIRLEELWVSKTIFPKEEALLEIVLNRALAKSTIPKDREDACKEILYRIEVKKCNEIARCKTADAPRIFYVKLSQLCRFYRVEPTGAGRAKFVLFMEKEVPPSHQMTPDVLTKIDLGHHVPEEMYPKTKTLLHRQELDENWFNTYFDIEEDLLVEKIEEEQSFKF